MVAYLDCTSSCVVESTKSHSERGKEHGGQVKRRTINEAKSIEDLFPAALTKNSISCGVSLSPSVVSACNEFQMLTCYKVREGNKRMRECWFVSRRAATCRRTLRSTVPAWPWVFSLSFSNTLNARSMSSGVFSTSAASSTYLQGKENKV